MVDRILLALAPGAQAHRRAADRERAAVRDRAARGAGTARTTGAASSTSQGARPAGIAALGLQQTLERAQRPRRRRWPPRPAADRREIDAQVGEHRHARRRSQHELAEIGRALPGQHLARLGDLERVADRRAERRIHGRQLADGRAAGADADVAHAHGQLARRGEVGHERALPHLDVQQDRVGAAGELLRHHREQYDG